MRQIKFFLLIFFFCLSIKSQLHAQVFNVDTVVYNGDPSNRINLVIMGDGYAITDTAKFRTDVAVVANYFLSIPPFNAYANFFNFFAIEVISNDSGNDHPGTGSDEPNPVIQPVTSVDNYLESRFDYGVHRCVYSSNTGLVFSIANTNFPQYDLVNVIVNTPYYGGCGGSVAFTTMNISSPEIFVHEFGHSFGDLSDEYEYGSSNCNPGTNQNINTSQQTDTSLLVWNKWLTATTYPTPAGTDCDSVGLYEGAQYCFTNWYRPQCNCKMRALNQPFCPVCMEQFIYKINSLVDLNDDRSPANTALTICKNSKQLFTVTQVKSIPNTVHTQWLVDGVPVLVNDTAFLLDASLLTAGIHQVKAITYDSTSSVRKALSSYQQVWNVSIINPQNGLPFTVNGSNLSSPYTQTQWFIMGDSVPVATTNSMICIQPGNYVAIGVDANGCIATSDTQFVACTTGLPGMLDEANDICVQPNPFTNELHISANDLPNTVYTLTITNVLGQVIYNHDVNTENGRLKAVVQADNIKSGLYFLNISGDHILYSRKIIRE